MNGFEKPHERIFGYTDARQSWHGEEIIRCRDCKHEFEEWGYPYCCRNAPSVVFEVHGDGFCKWGEPRKERR